MWIFLLLTVICIIAAWLLDKRDLEGGEVLMVFLVVIFAIFAGITGLHDWSSKHEERRILCTQLGGEYGGKRCFANGQEIDLGF